VILMPTTIENYMNIKERALELGCNIPSGLSFLPRNFDSAKLKSELIYESTVSDIRILFRDAKIAETKLEKPCILVNAGIKLSNYSGIKLSSST
jgi:hypothetical protein